MKEELFNRNWQSILSKLNNMQTFVVLSSTTITFVFCLIVFSCDAHHDGVDVEKLIGSRETCDVEGQNISVTDIPFMKCYDCICQHGFVECSKRKCPSIEGCNVLEDQQKDECCKKCKDKQLQFQGCVKNDEYHNSGTEWTDPRDPCKLFMCTVGVVTETTIRCYTPCDNPIPPATGQCCPTCSDCRVKGEIINGKTLRMSIEDPCVSCDCSSGILTCKKGTCPVLNCPDTKIVRGFGECCSQCLGIGKYLSPPKGACLLGTTIHRSGTQFTLDDCTQCACQNSTMHCEKKNCPILQCKQEYQEILPGRCCAECKDVMDNTEVEDENEPVDTDTVEDESEKYETENERSCTYAGEIFQHRETWNTTTCETCTCLQGIITCASVMCPAIKCPSKSILKVTEGQCCPICVQNEGVCTVFGGSHFRTFDGKLYAFIGSCKYKLASDCDSGTFKIRLKSTVTENQVTIKRISLKLGDVKIDLQQNRNTKINDEIIDLPYRLKSKLEISETNENIVVRSKIGIIIYWNYMGLLEITVPTRYRKQLCGLCGNFNSIVEDDLTTREGILVEDPATFAQSWTSGDDTCFETRKYGIRGCNPRKDQRLCNYVKGSVFEKCLKKINVTSYYEACLKDMCQCQPDDLQCHCESFASYVRDCRRLGILLPRWRKSVGC